MLSINGIHLENAVFFRGHEMEQLCQGDLYLGYRKLGFWSQDGWGGPDSVILEPGYSLEQLNKRIAVLNPDKKLGYASSSGGFEIEYDLELLMSDYLALLLDTPHR